MSNNKHKNCKCSTCYGTQELERMMIENEKHKKKVEKKLGKQFTNEEWFMYEIDQIFNE